MGNREINMQFNPKFNFWLGVVVTALIGIAGGTVHLTNAIPDAWIPTVVAWCGILSFLGSGLLTALHGFSSGQGVPLTASAAQPPGALPKAVIAVLVVGLATLALSPLPADAQIKKPPLTGDPIRDIGSAISSGNQGARSQGDPLGELAKKIAALSLADFKYAAALAHATGNNVTAPCWDEWVKLLTAQQQPLIGADGQPLTEPDPHLITSMERLSEMIRQLQPNSDLSVACAPAASAVQKDAATLIGAVLSGSALGLFKLPIPIP
jgi:hypothetical protein